MDGLRGGREGTEGTGTGNDFRNCIGIYQRADRVRYTMVIIGSQSSGLAPLDFLADSFICYQD